MNLPPSPAADSDIADVNAHRTQAADVSPVADDAASRLCARLASLATGIAGAALLGLVVVQGWQVFARYVLNDSPSWTEPVTLLLLATAMSLGAAAAVKEQRHFGFLLLAQSLPAAGRRALAAVSCAVIISTGGVLAGWGGVLLLDGLHIPMAGAPLPQSILYLPLAVGGALMVVFALEQLWRALRPPTGGR